MFKTLTIKAQLIGSMAIMGVMLIIGAALGIFGLEKSNQALDAVYGNQMPGAIAIKDSAYNLLRATAALDRVIIRPDAPNAAEVITRAENFIQQSEADWKRYLSLQFEGDEKKYADELGAKREIFLREGLGAMITAMRAHDRERTEQIRLQKMTPVYSDLNASVEKMTKFQTDTAAALYAASQARYHTIRNFALCGIVAGLLLVAASAFSLVRAIMNPLHEALAHFSAIAAGDLTTHIQVNSTNEMGHLMSGLQQMQQGLADTVQNIRQSSASIAAASSQIASGNMDLSSRTEQQASSLEETASSMEELTSTVRQNADNAKQANQLAATASSVAAKGGDVMSQVVETMDAIQASSTKIVDIISVIDGIAFQTNILALNAAVEAARAGEQGRGFAVVAAEVRTLAQRSANAAKEIKSLIDDSVQKVGVGGRLVEQAGATISEVVDGVRRVTDIMAEITLASEEQSTGIEQVNQAIGQMDQVTQQNAALVEEAAAAAQAMQDQAYHLSQTVSKFKVNEGLAAAVSAGTPQAARIASRSARPAPTARIGKGVDNFV